MTRRRPLPARALLLLLLALALRAQASAPPARGGEGADEPAPAGGAAGDAEAPSRWYLEREPPSTAELPPGLPSVEPELEALLRDGGVPGFYDGQFAATADRFDELVAVAHDEDLHHVLRTMAVMALQEAAQGERLRAALEPLLQNVSVELAVEERIARRFFRGGTPAGVDAERELREELDAQLSRHARFALAKAGQPGPVRERIELMEFRVRRDRDLILDPDAQPADFRVFFGRSLWFSIAYHYQQFDDFENAAKWFRDLTRNLRGADARWAHYNLACIAALQGRPEEAMEELREAVADGFADVAWMEEDGDLASLRGRADYEALRRELGAAPRPAAEGPAGTNPGPPVENPGGG